MRKWLQKHPGVFVGVAAAVGLFLIFCYWQRTLTVANSIENKLEDIPREEAVKSTFYSAQLKEKEIKAYQMLTQRLDNLEGGVVEFPEPLTGKQYQRVMTALEAEGYNYFYGFCEIPMSEDNVYLLESSSDNVSKVVDPVIAKAVLFVSCAEDINARGQYADDGTVENLDEIEKSYSVNQKDKEKEIQDVREETEKILDEIMEGLPAEYGEKRAVDYFLGWLDENMTTERNADTGKTSFYNIGELFDGVLIYNHLAALTKGAAGTVGYAKILAELCCRAGMEAHIVFGTWGRKGLTSKSYVLCAIQMNGQTIYVDASAEQAGDMGGLRYMTEEGAMNHMEFADYFSYE